MSSWAQFAALFAANGAKGPAVAFIDANQAHDP
jgi:hypothetical protein